jgi:hypothetical protein
MPMNDEPEVKKIQTSSKWSVVEKFNNKVADMAWLIFSAGLICGLISFGYEALTWLKTGEWLHLHVYNLFFLAKSR